MRRIAESRHLRCAHNRRPLLLPTLAPPLCSSLRRRLCLRCRWIELHPDRQLFFVQNFSRHQQEPLQSFAQQRLPQFANQRQLIAQ